MLWTASMLYVTGGAAFTDLRAGNTFVPSHRRPGGELWLLTGRSVVGATLGGGLEYAFSNNWSVGVEARYSWYGNQTFNTGLMTIGPAPLTFAPITQTVRYETFEVTGRLNWKFDWGGPVVARY